MFTARWMRSQANDERMKDWAELSKRKNSDRQNESEQKYNVHDHKGTNGAFKGLCWREKGQVDVHMNTNCTCGGHVVANSQYITSAPSMVNLSTMAGPLLLRPVNAIEDTANILWVFIASAARRWKRVALGFPVTHSGKMSHYCMNRSSAQQQCSFSNGARWSSGAALKSRKQMQPDKRRGCDCQSVCFPIVNTVCVPTFPAASPIPFDLCE